MACWQCTSPSTYIAGNNHSESSAIISRVNPQKEPIFSYGTLRDPEVQKSVIGRLVEGETDVLVGFKKSKITLQGKFYPIIVEEKDGIIEGVVLLVTSEELERIDEYETSAYRREKVTLRSGKKAWVYQK